MVKYVVGLRLAAVGIRSFIEAAARIKTHRVQIAQVLVGERRTPRIQQDLARLCQCRPVELFGPLTHPSLLGIGENQRADDAVRIRGLLRGSGITPAAIARQANHPDSTIRSALNGRRRSADKQLVILRAFRDLAGSRITFIQFWGRFSAKEVTGE